jgi:integrase/recombinase XerD
MEHIFKLKQILYQRNNSEVFIGVCLACIKGLLKYCQTQKSIQLKINPEDITIPKRPRREVVFLTSEEIRRFKESINLKPIYGLRFRTLVEVLLATGMRISEALSLNKNSIDFETQEARIIGKGNKERVVFFTEEALSWINKYLGRRDDKNEALFVTTGEYPRRLRNQDLTRYFKRQRKIAGINKKVTPHLLRHCFASHLAFNNCPFTEIKTLMGHERLDTTIRYYVGLTDKEKAKEAHKQYLNY